VTGFTALFDANQYEIGRHAHEIDHNSAGALNRRDCSRV
jgi:hypothetical protein